MGQRKKIIRTPNAKANEETQKVFDDTKKMKLEEDNINAKESVSKGSVL